MVPPLALALVLAVPAADPGACPPDAALACAAVRAALVVPGARAQVEAVHLASGRGCAPSAAEALRPVSASGEAPLRFTGKGDRGQGCQAFAWARVRVLAPGLVLTRAVRAGEPLEAAVRPAEVELKAGRSGPLPSVPEGARAARALSPGSPLLSADVLSGPLPGEPVTVLVRAGGGLELSQTGRAIPCGRDRACALLPSGRRVEGRLEGGLLVLEVP